MERNHDRAEDKTTMTISLERSLLERIDALAKRERRTRSNWVVKELEVRVAVLESFSGAGERADADAGGPSSSSTRYTALPQPTGADQRLDEETNPVGKPATKKMRRKK